MKRKNIDTYRDNDGIVELNKLEEYKEKGIVLGKNARFWMNVEGVRFLYKEYDDILPAFGEVLYSRMASMCGVECAKYEFAKYNGKIGTISYDFLDGKVYYNCLELTAKFGNTNFSLEEIKSNYDLLVLHNNKYNNMVSVKELLGQLFHSSDEEKKEIEIGLIKMFCLDTLFWHRDRNLWNYGIVVDEESDRMELAPVHDNSFVLCLEKGKEYIDGRLMGVINGDRLVDDSEENSNSFNMLFKEDNSMDQLIRFYNECKDEKVKDIINDIFKKFEVEKVVDELSKECKISDVVVLWAKAVLQYRKKTILKGLENAKIYDVNEAKGPNVTFNKRK